MFTVDEIIDNIIILENRELKNIFTEDISLFPNNIKEGDIVDFVDNKYVINKDSTKNKNKEVRNLFDSLKE